MGISLLDAHRRRYRIPHFISPSLVSARHYIDLLEDKNTWL
jgi:hypothetical protein